MAEDTDPPSGGRACRVWEKLDGGQRYLLSLMRPKDAFIHPFDDPLLWEGHATMITESAAQGPKPDAVVLAVGGGGLMCGVSATTRSFFIRLRADCFDDAGDRQAHQRDRDGGVCSQKSTQHGANDRHQGNAGAKDLTNHVAA